MRFVKWSLTPLDCAIGGWLQRWDPRAGAIFIQGQRFVPDDAVLQRSGWTDGAEWATPRYCGRGQNM